MGSILERVVTQVVCYRVEYDNLHLMAIWVRVLLHSQNIINILSTANWDCVSVIVKTGGDLRQEQLAVQLIQEFEKIWKEEGCACWVR